MNRKKFPFIILSANYFLSYSSFVFFLRYLFSIIRLSPAFPLSALAAQISLIWDDDTGPNVAGYSIYFGTAPGTYGNPIAGCRSGAGNWYAIPSLGVRRWGPIRAVPASMICLSDIHRNLHFPFSLIPFLAILFSRQHFCSNCILLHHIN
jgi:hypothetical protein